MSRLPVDIIGNILSRLPVKFLLRAKSVCKQWRSLISDPQFAKLHLTQMLRKDSNINPHRLLLSTCPNLQSIDYEAYNDAEKGNEAILELKIEMLPGYVVQLVGSCNGLVCLFVDPKVFILWNPCTRESRPLPEPEYCLRGWCTFGLGYDFSTDDYKLIKVSSRIPAMLSDETEVEILSIKTSVWRRICHPKIDMTFTSRGTFLHGWLHWVMKNVSGNANVYKIVSFDLAEEKFEEMVPLPDRLEEDHYAEILGLVVSGGCLCLIIQCGENQYEGWEMKEFGVKSSWTRLFSSSGDPCSLYHGFQRALCYTKSGKVVMDYDGDILYMYDPKERKFEKMTLLPNFGWWPPVIYSESLVSPNFYDIQELRILT